MATNIPVTTEKLYQLIRKFPVVTTDSRKIPARSMFFALKGENFDGNRFAGQALEQGAAIAIVDDPAVVKDHRYMVVDDVLRSLQQLARFHRNRMNIPVIGITGSNGKTTTKELIHAVLSRKYQTLATHGNLNNHIGVPLTLLSITTNTQIAVVEMGANHVGEIAFLCELARPTHGLITNIGRAHLEGFGGFDGVILAKTELYSYFRRHGGEVFLNLGDPLLTEHARKLNLYTYGLIPSASVSGTPEPGSDRVAVKINFPNGRSQLIRSSLFGSYNNLNMVAAACVGSSFGISIASITRAIESYTPDNNRSQLFQTARNLLVLDAYNANPSSMTIALKDFDQAFPENKIVILGDMLELGSETEQDHRQILKLLESLDLKRVFLVGPVFSQLNTRKRWRTFATSDMAMEWFNSHPVKKANILLKGSRGIQLEKIVEYL